MGLFKHPDDEAKAKAAEAELAAHPEPVTIDLGEASQLYPAQCKVLVKAEDAARAREVFTTAGFLEA